MRTLAVLLLLGAPLAPAGAQEADAPEGAIIASADVSGFDSGRLSPGLRQDISGLVGAPLDRARLDALAARIESEHPEVVAAVRSVAAPDGGARVVFLVARIADDADLQSNINARYVVESVDIEGIPERDISQTLRDDLQALVGSRLDPDEAERLDDRLAGELPGYEVRRRISRGSRPGRIRLRFEVTEIERNRWLPFAPTRSKLVYHSDQGWSGALDIPVGSRNHRVTVGLAFDDNDSLIEEYSGIGFRVESRRLASERLGASLEVSRFNQTWRPQTLSAVAADPRIPEPYRTRLTIEPLVTVALSRALRVVGGLSVAELESLSRSPDSQMATAAVAGIVFDRQWDLSSGASHTLDASYRLHKAAAALESDLAYTRHLGQAQYRYRTGRSTVLASVAMGRIAGRAPLFERFTLGDASTLRGWNRYDLAPAGGDRMIHQSIEYRYRGFAFFVDSGSVWDEGADARVRFSTGFGFHGDHAFATIGFPLNTSEASAAVMLGVRF